MTQRSEFSSVDANEKLFYFAYGSNLSLARLRARVPSAQRLGIYALPEHQLRFHKAGRDGSAKCDAWLCEGVEHIVHGAVFAMSPADKPALDEAEGLGWGYAEKQVAVVGPDGEALEAFTYCAIRLDPSLRPYHWYLDHVLRGAQECGLPEEYIMAIRQIESMDDPDSARDTLERALHG